MTQSTVKLCMATAALFIAHPQPITAQETDSTRARCANVDPRVWTADDLLLSQDARSFRISPDGQNVAWIQTAMSYCVRSRCGKRLRGTYTWWHGTSAHAR